MASIIPYTNDQIAKYCEVNEGLTYSIENTLHHVVNGSDTEKGLTMCNQEWADNCALHNVSPDLIMHDIRECLSIAVDCGLAVEVIRLTFRKVFNLKIYMAKRQVIMSCIIIIKVSEI